MNDKLYATMKTILLKYNDQWEQPHSFADLYSFSKQFNHGRTFKKFVTLCQEMGVESVVKRLDIGLKRVLIYKPENDRYVTGEISIAQQCPTCNGTGIVKTRMIPPVGEIL